MPQPISQAIQQHLGNLKKDTFLVKEWGQEITILELSANLLEQWESHAHDFDRIRKNPNSVQSQGYSIRSVLVGMCICETDGSRPFNNKDGYTKLSRLSGTIIEMMFDKCQKLNKLGRYFEEEVGNSEDGQSSDSSESLLEAVRSIPKPS